MNKLLFDTGNMKLITLIPVSQYNHLTLHDKLSELDETVQALLCCDSLRYKSSKLDILYVFALSVDTVSVFS